MRELLGMIGVTVLALGGCLSDGRRLGGDVADSSDGDSSQGDTGADTGTDVGGDTGSDTSSCTDQGCDDGDPCTADQCNAATGQCEHYEVPGRGDGAPFPGCAGDADCEDGDPCTTNSCVSTGVGCGSGGTMCVTEVIVGCGDCTTGCDDGDACTRDECREGRCFHAADGDCMRDCISGEVIPLATIRTQAGTWPEPLKTAGELFFHPFGMGCDDGPTCDCVGSPGLRDAAFDLVLQGSDDGSLGFETWSCQSSGCGTPLVRCEPALRGVRYRAWGRGLQEWELTGQGAPAEPAVPVPPPPSVVGLSVSNFCLETKGKALVGRYNGSLELADVTLDFGAQIIDDGGLVLQYSGATCPSCPAGVTLHEGRVRLVVGDGWVELEANLPSPTGERLRRVRLYANRSTLAGSYGDDGGVTPFIAVPLSARMVLTRSL